MDISPVQYMSNLRHLWITGPQAMGIAIAFENDKNISYLNIAHLHILVPVRSWKPYHRSFLFFKLIHNLQVLQISNAPELEDFIDLPQLFTLLRGNPIVAISLRRFQSFRTASFIEGLNLTSILSTSFNETLEYLDLSGNSLQFLIGNFIQIAPKLKVLDLSENLLTTSGSPQFAAPYYTYSLAEPVFLHPSLEVIDVGRQYVPEMSRIIHDSTTPINKPSKHKRSASSRASFLDSIFGFRVDPNIISCTNGSININEILTNRSMFANVYNCYKISYLAPWDHYSVPAEYMPLLELDSSCTPDIRIPVAPKLHDLRLDEFSNIQRYINDDQAYRYPGICLASNEIYSLNLAKTPWTWVKEIPETFQGLDNLIELDVSYTYFSNLSMLTFEHISHLERLDIGGNELGFEADLNFCNNLPNLKFINMSDSSLMEIPNTIFHGCKMLEAVDLSNNRLRVLPESLRRDLDNIVERNGQLTLDLSGNVFSCHCHESAHSTIKWLQKTKVHLVNYATYTCFNDDGVGIIYDKNLDDFEECIAEDNIIAIVFISISSSTGFYLFIALSFTINKYKYRVLTIFNRLRLQWKRKFSAHPPDGNFNYDVTITYIYQQQGFVLTKLLPLLEDKNGLKCCIRERDLPAQGVELDNISQGLHQSNLFLILVSPCALRDTTFNFELNLAKRLQSERLRVESPIYLVFDSNAIGQNETGQRILDSDSCFIWPGNPFTVNQNAEQTRLLEQVVSLIYSRCFRTKTIPRDNNIMLEQDNDSLLSLLIK